MKNELKHKVGIWELKLEIQLKMLEILHLGPNIWALNHGSRGILTLRPMIRAKETRIRAIGAHNLGFILFSHDLYAHAKALVRALKPKIRAKEPVICAIEPMNRAIGPYSALIIQYLGPISGPKSWILNFIWILRSWLFVNFYFSSSWRIISLKKIIFFYFAL